MITLLAAMVEPCLFFACCIDDPNEYITLLFNGRHVSDKISIGEKYIYSQNLKTICHAPMHNEPLFDHLVGSCNGLVCTFQHHHLLLDPIYICNPLTREYVHLPQLVVNKEDVNPDCYTVEGEVDLFCDMACGFGYVRSANEYKVVRIHYLELEVGNVEVYTFGSGCGWRAIGKVPYRLDSTWNGRGTYANDAIYWIQENGVVAFDLADEKFRLLSSVLPCLQNRKFRDRCGFVVLGRRLCFYMDTLRMEIWSLMISSDSKEAWRMEFVIDYEAKVCTVGCGTKKFQPILLTNNGEIIFLYGKSVLYSYDTKTTLLKMISNEASSDYFEAVEAIAHVNTFASSEATGENSKRYTVRPRRVRTPWDDVIDELDRVALGEEIDTTLFRLR
ncbi:F-box protein At3g07870-like [Papaver somniferum]|uniref:F-box protein At3g07870-like n=1 Tax=Papaver somniferum TaxID=3469 RepID=UPI000E6FFE32|nr:F-box protein At3g07870-like [Papaver somniferum]